MPSFSKGSLFLQAQGEALISSGLAALLVRLFSGQRLEQVLAAKVTFPAKIGLEKLISLQRRNGLATMLAKVKGYGQAELNLKKEALRN